jgi:hypothetical protein
VPTRRGDARIAENGFASSSVNKSAKVVLVFQPRRPSTRP